MAAPAVGDTKLTKREGGRSKEQIDSAERKVDLTLCAAAVCNGSSHNVPQRRSAAVHERDMQRMFVCSVDPAAADRGLAASKEASDRACCTLRHARDCDCRPQAARSRLLHRCRRRRRHGLLRLAGLGRKVHGVAGIGQSALHMWGSLCGVLMHAAALWSRTS